MAGDDDRKKGYDKIRDQILELCKLAQGNITTIHWCKSQIKKRLKVLDRLVERLSSLPDSKSGNEASDDTSRRIQLLIKKQTTACKELGEKIKLEILMTYLKLAHSIKSYTSQETLALQCISLVFIWARHTIS